MPVTAKVFHHRDTVFALASFDRRVPDCFLAAVPRNGSERRIARLGSASAQLCRRRGRGPPKPGDGRTSACAEHGVACTDAQPARAASGLGAARRRPESGYTHLHAGCVISATDRAPPARPLGRARTYGDAMVIPVATQFCPAE